MWVVLCQGYNVPLRDEVLWHTLGSWVWGFFLLIQTHGFTISIYMRVFSGKVMTSLERFCVILWGSWVLGFSANSGSPGYSEANNVLVLVLKYWCSYCCCWDLAAGLWDSKQQSKLPNSIWGELYLIVAFFIVEPGNGTYLALLSCHCADVIVPDVMIATICYRIMQGFSWVKRA
jgi:hypothetical protein